MNASIRKNRTLPKLFFILILSIVAMTLVYAGFRKSEWSWPVPEEAKKLENPLQPSPAALQSAKSLYRGKCANCHGDTGKGDGPDAYKYDPAPVDFTEVKRMSNASDGELFYKISEGKKPMPVFKGKLSEEQRWQLILLIRSFALSSASSDKINEVPKASAPASKP